MTCKDDLYEAYILFLQPEVDKFSPLDYNYICRNCVQKGNIEIRAFPNFDTIAGCSFILV